MIPAGMPKTLLFLLDLQATEFTYGILVSVVEGIDYGGDGDQP